jgi:hypothetical protein
LVKNWVDHWDMLVAKLAGKRAAPRVFPTAVPWAASWADMTALVLETTKVALRAALLVF